MVESSLAPWILEEVVPAISTLLGILQPSVPGTEASGFPPVKKKKLKALRKQWKKAVRRWKKFQLKFKRLAKKKGKEAAELRWGDQIRALQFTRESRKLAYQQARANRRKSA
ncbi:MAG: hypothetical protein H6555_09920 [Lewinellaceae bacterium]|nr:hypothetical protein [Lewinellaceae bacterium]